MRSGAQLTDIFTKALDPKPYEEKNIVKLGLINIYNANLRGIVRNKRERYQISSS